MSNAVIPSGVIVQPPPIAASAPPALGAGVPGTPPVVMQNGGIATGTGFFKSVNLIELGFYILGAVSLIAVISLSRRRIEAEEKTKDRLTMRLDDVEAEMAQLKAKTKKKPGFL